MHREQYPLEAEAESEARPEEMSIIPAPVVAIVPVFAIFAVSTVVIPLVIV